MAMSWSCDEVETNNRTHTINVRQADGTSVNLWKVKRSTDINSLSA